MHLYFDESGDFAFPTDRYDVYVQAGLIVPDSFVNKVEHYVANKNDELGTTELHAAELPEEELAPICEWLTSGPLSLVGQATDTAVMTAAQLRDYRQEQAARLAENLEQYKAADGRWAGAEAWYTRHIKRAELSSRVSDSEYIQAHMLVGLIHAALFKSIVRYIDDSWRAELVDFYFILDAKLPDKLAAGEKGPRRPPRPFPWQQRLRTRSTEHVERGTASPVRLQVLRTKRERQPQPYFRARPPLRAVVRARGATARRRRRLRDEAGDPRAGQRRHPPSIRTPAR
jgi:hypothetical protein